MLLLLPLVPGLGTEKFGAQIWIQVGPYSFQPAEAAKVLLAIAFASYLVEKRDVLALAGYRVLGIDLPRARDLGPILVMWLISLAILVWQRDLGTSLLFFGLFVMMLYVATERAGWAVLGTLLFAAGAYFGYLNFSHVRAPGGCLARSLLQLRRLLSGDQCPVRHGLGWPARHRPGAGPAGPDTVGPQRLHRRRDRRRAWHDRAHGSDPDLRLDRRARPADRAAMPGAVRQAAGYRPVVRVRAPGVHHHRRRDSAAAADRPDHAVHVAGRLLAGLQLDRRRAACW